MNNVILKVILVSSICWNLLGCATIISGTTQDIKVESTPSGAQYKIEKLTVSGPVLVSEGKTPVTVNLSRSEHHQLLTLSQQGYEIEYIPISAGRENGFVWGNLLFGGLIGLAIDGISGASVVLEPEEVNAKLFSITR